MSKSGAVAVTAALLLAAACANTMPQTFSGVTPRAPSDAYSCALAELARAEYVVLDADRDAGFIRAERQRSGATRQFLLSQTFYDLVTVALIPEGEATKVQATAASQVEEDGDRRSTGIVTHDRAKEMATQIVGACGERREP